MSFFKFRGETAVEEAPALRMPLDYELRSRYEEPISPRISKLVDEGKLYKISSMYGNRPDIMDRKK